MTKLVFIIILNAVFLLSLIIFKRVIFSIIVTIISLFLLISISPQKLEFINKFSLRIDARIKKKDRPYLLIIGSLLVFIFLQPIIGLNPAFIVSFFLIVHFFKLDSRSSFISALLLLIITAFLYSFGNEPLANGAAVLAYYFLAIGTAWQFIELKKEEKSQPAVVSAIKEDLDRLKRTEAEQTINLFHPKPLKKTLSKYENSLFIIVTTTLATFTAVLLGYSIIQNLHKDKSTEQIISPINQKVNISPTITPIFTKLSLTILNGTTVKGLAASTSARLKSLRWDKKVNSISIGNADSSNYKKTIIKYSKGIKNLADQLEKDLSWPVEVEEIKEATTTARLILILGK